LSDLRYDSSMSIHGSIRYKSVDHDAPMVLNSGVSLPEAVQVWIESLTKAGRDARLIGKRWYRVERKIYLEVIDARLV
jgi:hypothetical protein